jgi:ribosomal protein S18 acetylase RimI-like enzyme
MARRFRALTSERLNDLPPRCVGCAFWESPERLPKQCGATRDQELASGWLDYVNAQWGECGRIAYEGGESFGFVKYAPPAYFPQVANFSAGAPSEDAVLLACLHVDPDARHVGLGTTLLHAALRDLVGRGVRYVEAYAVHDPKDIKESPVVSVNFLLRQGFAVVYPHPEYPLLRLEMKSLAAWTENLEAVLESLRLPMRVGSRVPVSYMGPDGTR